MSLIKHNCPSCGADLEFPEQVERISCRRCGDRFNIESFADVVSLKKIKAEPSSSSEASYESFLFEDDPECNLNENIELLDSRIDRLNRRLKHLRSSAFSSLSVAFLFFFFGLVWLLAERNLIALFCGGIAAAMAVVAGHSLRDSARSRSALTLLISKREQLMRRFRSGMPRIY